MGDNINGVPITKDGEWEEDELHSLIMDLCMDKCKDLAADIAAGKNMAWEDKSLLYDGPLCQKITEYTGDQSLVDIYDSTEAETANSKIDLFLVWVNNTIKKVVDNNRYHGYIKDGG